MAGGADDAHGGGALHATFHYSDGERETRANLLLQHLQSGEQVVVLQGDPGSGRTHLLRRILARSDHGLRIYAVHSESGLTLTDLLLGLLEHLQLPPSPSQAPDRIRAHAVERLTALSRSGERPVLAMDDADVLGDDLLESLLSLRDDTRAEGAPPMGLMLVGSPRLTLRLTELAGLDHDHAPVTVALHGFDRAATRAFLMEGLKADGDAGGQLLEALDIDAILAASGGRPGAILETARRQLAGEASPTAPSGPRRPIRLPDGLLPGGSRRSIGLVSAATIALIGTLLALSFIAGDPAEDQPERIESTEITAAEDPVATPGEEDTDSRDTDARAPDELADTDEPAVFDAPDTYGFGEEDDTSDEAGTDLTGEPADAAREPDPATETEPTETAGAPEDTVADTAPESETTDDTAAPEPESELERTLAAGRDWRAQHADNVWTIQLVAAHNPEAVLNWMERHADAAELHLLHTQRDGQDWFVVVTGADEDRDSASERREGLPDALRDAGAWIRQLQGLDNS